jgi:capsular polysaccharide biosynthesis protein
MEIKYFFNTLKRRKKVVFYAWLIFLILGSIATFSQPLKYEVKSRLLIVQNISNTDPYTISKSNQYLSSLLSQVVYSNSFFNLVTNPNSFDIDQNYFSNDYSKQMKIWAKTISASSNDAGIIEISIYHPNPYQAKQIALGVNDVIINKGFNYQSANENVQIKVIDQPLTSNYPVKPNLFFNFLAFSLLGIIGGLMYLYFFPNKKIFSFYKKINTKQVPLSSVVPNVAQAYRQPVYQQPEYHQPEYRKPEYQQLEYSQAKRESQSYSPVEKIYVHTNIEDNRNNTIEANPDNNPIHGNIKNVMNRF